MGKSKSRPTRGPKVRGSHFNENVQRAVRVVVKAKMTSNQKDLDASTTASEGLSGYRGPQVSRGGSSVERMKGGSYGVGFQGPRGYGTPTGKVSKQEGNGEHLSPVPQRPCKAHFTSQAAASRRFAGDILWAAETLGYDYGTVTPSEPVLVKKGTGKGKRWRRLDLNESPNRPEACGLAVYTGPKE